MLSEKALLRGLLKLSAGKGGRLASHMEFLDKIGLLRFILPEVKRMKGFLHNRKYHPEGDVWEHTMAALRTSKAEDPITNLSILLHDIGKPDVYELVGENRHTYFRHARKSFELVQQVCERIGISGKPREAMEFAILNHMKFHNIMDMNPKKIVAMVKSPHWDILADVARADQMAKGKRSEASFQRMVDRAIGFSKIFGKPQAKKLINGYTVMKLTGLKPGIRVGEIIDTVSSWIERNKIKDWKRIEERIGSFKPK